MPITDETPNGYFERIIHLLADSGQFSLSRNDPFWSYYESARSWYDSNPVNAAQLISADDMEKAIGANEVWFASSSLNCVYGSCFMVVLNALFEIDYSEGELPKPSLSHVGEMLYAITGIEQNEHMKYGKFGEFELRLNDYLNSKSNPSIAEYIADIEDHAVCAGGVVDWARSGDKEKCLEAGDIWEIIHHPNTPVGFNMFHSSTLHDVVRALYEHYFTRKYEYAVNR